jgi:hypothetical protein
MRRASVTITMLLLLSTMLRAEPPKPKPDVGAGRIAWFDITSSSLAQSKAFYGNLFGWEFRPVKGSDRRPIGMYSRTPVPDQPASK